MPSTPLRQRVLTSARSVVIKLGTQLLTVPGKACGDGIDMAYLSHIAQQIQTLRKRGVQVTVVSSGAIAAGCAQLGLKKRPTDVAELQAVAAVGQRRLMTRFHEAFSPLGVEVAQLLLIRDDFDQRERFLNIRNCVATLHTMGCLPIINENDTVAVEEIRFGDNDLLSAFLAHAIDAELLVLLTSVEGLLDEAGKTVDLVTDLQSAAALARDKKTQWGSGGISSKLDAARLVTQAGAVLVIANGRKDNILVRLLDGERLGTVFAPAARKLDSKRRWIGLTKRPAGTVTIDAGAAEAVRQRGKSLLASGITAVTGLFDRGELLMVRDPQGQEIARGLSNYSSEEIRQIMGQRSSHFEKILGRPAYAEVIHRDNLVVTAPAS